MYTFFNILTENMNSIIIKRPAVACVISSNKGQGIIWYLKLGAW